MHDEPSGTSAPLRENPERKDSLFVEMRSDLEIAIVPRGQSTVAVVKDPIAHRFYEMSPSDVEIARHLRTHSDMVEQVRELRKNVPAETRNLSDREIVLRAARISAELRATGLAHSRGDSTAAQTSIQRTLLGGLRNLTRILFIRFRLFDPTRFLDSTARWVAPFFSQWFLWTILIAFCGTYALFIAKGDRTHSAQRGFPPSQRSYRSTSASHF
jgi:hypothetical protein